MTPGDVLGLMTVVTGIVTAIVLRGPLGKALADRIAGRTGPATDPGPAEALDGALAELDELRHRLAEVEERQDFTERMVARRSDPGRLGSTARET